MPVPTGLTAALRVLVVALMVVMFSGIASLVNAATHEHTSDCSDCDGGCPGNGDPHNCPPGPLCPCAPHVVPAERVSFVLAVPVVATQRLCTWLASRMPASVIGDGVFHPPRQLA